MKIIALTFLLLPACAFAQDMGSMDMAQDMTTSADMPAMKMTGALGAYGMTREASGTSWQPDAAPMTGIMQMWGV